jgi:2-keto-4-pentenoate hydratase/2-oxohepta-3-ene-1,7-dioic acid hydratase in catechol pathway
MMTNDKPDPLTDVQRFSLATILGSTGASPAVVTDRGVLSLKHLLGQAPDSVDAMLGDWDAHCDAIAAALAEQDGQPDWVAPTEVTFGPPLARPSAIYCSGANFYDHVAEMGQDPPDKDAEDAFHFLVPPASMTGDRHLVIRPEGVQRLDWEVELVAVIGKRAEHVGVDEALGYVAGYMVANDISVRDKSIFHPIFGVRWVPSKGLATMTPIGPGIVPARFVENPMRLRISTHVNGEIRQDSNTDQMIWTLQEQIASLSRGIPLLPGDLILTGTPAGTAAAHGRYLADGDVVNVSVEGIGTLVNTVAASGS